MLKCQMMEIPHLFISIAVISCCIFFSQCSAAAPNIVFILADDLGWDDVGFHGSEIKTPNIDRLAKEGVILNNYYVQPMCTPTRASILTGRYPIHTGMQHYVIVGSQPYGLPLKEKTLAQYLKSLGYKTHAVGKWHLGFCKKEYLPTYRGFDSHLGYYLGKEDHFDHYTEDGGYFGYDFHRDGKVLWNESEVYGTNIFTSEAESIILSHNKSEPLFLYLAEQVVHSGNRYDPIQAPQEYIDRFPYIKNFARRKFAGMVSALDDSVGRVYKALQDSGLADNTILAFSTDNGGPTNGFDRNAACNWPLRGCKRTVWQGGVRGVGFVHSPLLQNTGYVNNELMHAVDWLPTLVSKAVAMDTEENLDENSSMENLDGVNQWDAISQKAVTPRKEVLVNIDPITKIEAIIVGDFKLLRGQLDHGKYDGWYPPMDSSGEYPPGNEGSEDFSIEFKSDRNPVGEGDNSQETPKMTEKDLDNLIAWMNEEYKEFLEKSNSVKSSPSYSGLHFRSEKNVRPNADDSHFDSKSSSQNELNVENVIVQCGPKPANASTNCKPKKEFCVFHLASDPCEYNNLAPALPKVAKQLRKRLHFYKEGMIPPGNKPEDPRGNPQLHGGVWQPWL